MEYYRIDCGAPVRAPVGPPLECHKADFAAVVVVVVVVGVVATANLAVAPTDVPVGNLTDNLDLVGAPAVVVWATLAVVAADDKWLTV